MVKTTIPLLANLGVETFRVSRRKKNIILEVLGVREYAKKKCIHRFVIVG
jgi:hypothetical protein